MLLSKRTNWKTKKNLGEVECQDCGSDSLTPLNVCEEGEVQKKLMINYAYIDMGRLWEGLWN